MKKLTLLAAACALLAAPAVNAQETKEDPTQGYVINSFKDNWFITAQGGANVNFSRHDVHRQLSDRFAPNAGLSIGKWVTPAFGARLNFDWMKLKGLGTEGVVGSRPNEPMTNGYFKTSHVALSPTLDLMVNFTNLLCGYNPDRVYGGFTVYAGGGAFSIMARNFNSYENTYSAFREKDRVLTYHLGLINSVNLTDKLAMQLDVRGALYDGYIDHLPIVADYRTDVYLDLQAFLGLTYSFGKSTWNHPVVPVCPPAQNCDAVIARLATADAKIAELENALREALNRPAVVEQVEEKAPLASFFYQINSARLTREDGNVLAAIADVMKANPDVKYVLTGWADNYTGTPEYNDALRHKRVNAVYDRLVKLGVPAAQLTATVNNGSLCGLEGNKYVALDRAVTIDEAE